MSRTLRLSHRTAAALAALALLVALPGPARAQDDQLREQVLQLLFPYVHGTVTAEAVKISWTEPVTISGLHITDPEGQTVLSAKTCGLTKSLGELFRSPMDPGPVRLTDLQIFVRINENGGINVRDVMGDWFVHYTKNKTLEDLLLRLENAHVHMVDLASGEQLIVSPIDFRLIRQPDKPLNREFGYHAILPLHGLEFGVEGRYDRDGNEVIFDEIAWEHQWMRAGARLKGRIREVIGGAVELELNGLWHYDWSTVTDLVQRSGHDLELLGQGEQPIALRVEFGRMIADASGASRVVGDAMEQAQDLWKQISWTQPVATQVATSPRVTVPEPQSTSIPEPLPAPQPEELPAPRRDPHWLDSVHLETAVAWEAARFGGFFADPAVLPIRLEDGVLSIGPTPVPMNEGLFHAAANLDLRPEYPTIVLNQGWLLENVILTPEMCHNALLFMAPVLAESANVEGSISLGLQHAVIPLGAPAAADVLGDLVVHQVRADLSPSFGDLARLVGVPPVVRLVDDSQTRFHLTEGRLHHQGLGFLLGNNPLATSGSVGLDRSLDLLAEVTFPLDWLPNGPLGQRLKGTRVTVPIAGTLDHPAVGVPDFTKVGFDGQPLPPGVAEAPGILEELADRLRQRLEPGPLPPVPPGELEVEIAPRPGILDRLRIRRGIRQGVLP